MNSAVSEIKAISLRRATVADAQAIAAVRVEGWQTTYRGLIPDAYLDEMCIEDSVAHWKTVLSALSDASEKACVYVAVSDDHVVGFAAGHKLDAPKLGYGAELSALYLRPAWQRSGIGRRLLLKVARTLEQQGAQQLLVWVISGNHSARHFYEEMGAELLLEQEFTWDGMDLREVAYGWNELAVLQSYVQAMSSDAALH